MRMRRSRIRTYHLKKAEVKRDREGSTYTEYGSAIQFRGEVWPAGGRLQAEMYGDRLSYIRNVRIQGDYSIEQDANGVTHYVFEDENLDLREHDGLCLYVPEGSDPDYRIISIKPYMPLRLEAEKL